MLKELMTLSEVAEYLRIKERKVYELIEDRSIPCSRVGGKWLFPRSLIDLWILENLQWRGPTSRPQRPRLLIGSHDPLLDWAIRQSRCDLATLYTGSIDGLHRYAQGDAMICGIHVLDAQSGDYNVPLIMSAVPGDDTIILQWAWRDQGLIVAPENPLEIHELRDLVRPGVRVINRQEGAGSRLLLEYLLNEQGLEPGELNCIQPPARSESEVAEAISSGRADVGMGIRAVVRNHGLEFVPLQRERYDLVMSRRDYFDETIQSLLEFCKADSLKAKAADLGGYDINDLGKVIFNGR